MRNLLILVLGAVVVWLLMERHRLMDELTAAKTEVEASQKKAVEIEQQLTRSGTRTPSVTHGRQGSWLDAHLERGAKALAPQKNGR